MFKGGLFTVNRVSVAIRHVAFGYGTLFLEYLVLKKRINCVELADESVHVIPPILGFRLAPFLPPNSSCQSWRECPSRRCFLQPDYH